MTKALIFPANNKGGVGKTTVLAELVANLAQSQSVGVIDFDMQSALAGTLLGDFSIGMQPYEFYDGLQPQDVVIRNGTELTFVETRKTYRVRVKPAIASVTSFPVGMMYRNPDRKEKLEQIIEAFKDKEVLAIDFPPFPDPAMILDHSILPMLEQVGDYKLFPIIVSTPDHNVIQIGLDEYFHIRDYLLQEGIPEDKISPIHVLNKVELRREGERGTEISFAQTEFDKLKEMGIFQQDKPEKEDAPFSVRRSNATVDNIFYPSSFNKHFTYRGQRFRSVWIPQQEVVDGSYAVNLRKKPQVHHFPEIYKALQSQGLTVRQSGDAEDNATAYQLAKLANYIRAMSNSKQRSYFNVDVETKDLTAEKTEAVKNIEACFDDIYRSFDENPYKEYFKFEHREVKGRRWKIDGGHFEVTVPCDLFDLDALLSAIQLTQAELEPTKTTPIREGKEDFLKYACYGTKTLSIEVDGAVALSFDDEHSTLFYEDGSRLKIKIHAGKEERRVDTYMPQVNRALATISESKLYVDCFIKHLAYEMGKGK